MSNKVDGLWSIDTSSPLEEQDKLFKLIDGLYKSGFNLPSIKLVPNFAAEKRKIGDKTYNCTILNSEIQFTTSESMGVWGIEGDMKIVDIITFIQTEIREGKINILLKDG